MQVKRQVKKLSKMVSKGGRQQFHTAFLEIAAQTCLYYMIYASVLAGLCKGNVLSKDWFVKGIVFVVPLVVFYILRKTTVSFIVFLMLHILITAGMYILIPDKSAGLLLAFCTGLSALISLFLRIQNKQERPWLAWAGVFLVSYGIGGYTNSEILKRVSVLAVSVFGLSEMILIYLENMRQFFVKNKRNTSIPYERIQWVGNVMMLVFLFCGAAVIFLFKDLSPDLILTALKNIMLGIVGWLLAFFLKESNDVPQTEAFQAQIQMADMFTQEISEKSQWLEILEQILATVLKAAVAAGIVFLAAYGIYRIYRKYKQKMPDEEIQESSTFLWKEERVKKRKNRRTIREFFTGSNNMKIRKMYKKFVKGRMKKGRNLPASCTPEEIRIELFPEVSGGPKMTEYYEMARYGIGECDRNTVEAMKETAGSEHK